MVLSDNKTIAEVSSAIYARLAGLPEPDQKMIIADLVAMWLAGHEKEQRSVRLEQFIGIVEVLTPINGMLYGEEP